MVRLAPSSAAGLSAGLLSGASFSAELLWEAELLPAVEPEELLWEELTAAVLLWEVLPASEELL